MSFLENLQKTNIALKFYQQLLKDLDLVNMYLDTPKSFDYKLYLYYSLYKKPKIFTPNKLFPHLIINKDNKKHRSLYDITKHLSIYFNSDYLWSKIINEYYGYCISINICLNIPDDLLDEFMNKNVLTEVYYKESFKFIIIGLKEYNRYNTYIIKCDKQLRPIYNHLIKSNSYLNNDNIYECILDVFIKDYKKNSSLPISYHLIYFD
jgi:hypothetical protein